MSIENCKQARCKVSSSETTNESRQFNTSSRQRVVIHQSQVYDTTKTHFVPQMQIKSQVTIVVLDKVCFDIT